MTLPQLDIRQLALLGEVFQRHPEVTRVVLFGSRAKGTARPDSDIDLAVGGCISTLQIEALAEDLDLLPLPYQFDVQPLDAVGNAHLAAHIGRVGIEIYSAAGAHQN